MGPRNYLQLLITLALATTGVTYIRPVRETIGLRVSPAISFCSSPMSLQVDSRKLEHGCKMMYAGFLVFLWFGVGGRSCSSFLGSTVVLQPNTLTLGFCCDGFWGLDSRVANLGVQTYSA